MKLQSAVDYLSSYGLALTIIVVAFLAMYSIALAPNNPSIYCTPTPGFNCNFIDLNSSGVLTAKISQATGTQITINGAACASQQSSGTDTPAYGNLYVANTITYYETPIYYPPGNIIYSGGTYVLRVYCYGQSNVNPSGQIATGLTGKGFAGYIWINYTIPNYGKQVQKIATFSTVYS